MNNPGKAIIDEMLARGALVDLPADDALDRLARFVDAAGDCGHRRALKHAHTLAASLRPRCSASQLSLLDYFEANAWSEQRRLNHREGMDAWAWDQPELENEVVCLRQALKGSAALPRHRQVQVLTNLGNILSHLGRPVEAVACYDRALVIAPKFGMALGNRGLVFCTYATYHYDTGHKRVFLARAGEDFAAALKYDAEPGAHAGFAARLKELGKRKLRRPLKDFALKRHSLGKNPSERRFRAWALKERLFLNGLNDLGPLPIAARDVIQLPSIITDLQQGPTFHAFFNQLKQEYAAARWLYFEALFPNSAAGVAAAIADREIMLMDARDGARFGLRLEKLKLSFRSAYSLLDKIAVFLNAYLELGLPPHTVTLRSLWFEDPRAKPLKLHPKLPKENLPLRGLYWLSRDFVESNKAFMSAMEPDATGVATTRNRLEHQFLRITHFREQPWKGDLGYNLSPDQLRDRALRLLRSARAAIIYLVLAMHAYEAQHRTPPSGPRVSDQLSPNEPNNFPLFEH